MNTDLRWLTFAMRVNDEIDKRGWTDQQVSALTCISAHKVSELRLGRLNEFTVEELLLVSGILRCDLKSLFTGP